MTQLELITLLLDVMPHQENSHIMWWLMNRMMYGDVRLFMQGLMNSLLLIDDASPGYANDRVNRILALPGVDDDARESLYQIVAEIYCAAGAVQSSDTNEHGKPIFSDEPSAVSGGKNPEFSSRFESIPYAVEVKSPSLIKHRRARAANRVQLTTRLPGANSAFPGSSLPRDNPVKDFLISANAKFEAYSSADDACRILSIVCYRFVYEPIAALTSPVSGLFTDRSFHAKSDESRIRYPYIDGIVVCGYQSWIAAAFLGGPSYDCAYGSFAFMDYHVPIPPKAFIQCPDGKEVPENLLKGLGATPIGLCRGAEYQPIEVVQWIDLP